MSIAGGTAIVHGTYSFPFLLCEGHGRLFPSVILNVKKDTWLMHMHTHCSMDMCLVNIHVAASNEPSGGENAQTCSSKAQTKPGDMPVAFSPKASKQMASALLSVLTLCYGSWTKYNSWMWIFCLLVQLYWQLGRHPRAFVVGSTQEYKQICSMDYMRKTDHENTDHGH